MPNFAYRELKIGPAGSVLPEADVVDAIATPTGLDVTFGDQAVELLSDWLRDNCACDTCRIRQTDERRWQPWLDSGPARITSHRVEDGTLRITWATGHESSFTSATWRSIAQAANRGVYVGRLWSEGYTIATFDHDDVVANPDTQRSMFEAFRRDGAALVTGSPTEPGSVIPFLQSIGVIVRDSSMGLIFDVKLDPAGYNVAYTAEHVPPHNDNAQSTNPPSGQVLAMLVNDATGGETIVVDGFSVLDQLHQRDPAAVDVLARVSVGFRQYSSHADGFTRMPLVEQDRDGRFTHLRFSNQLMQPLPFDDPDLEAWYAAYRQLGAMVSDPANQVSFRLQAGYSLIVNNHRVLHSRTAFIPDGPRHLQDVYFDADDISGRLAQLTGEATNNMVIA